MKTDRELTENIGLPLHLLEQHDPWPAYVTYTSPMVKRLIEKSRARDLAWTQALEESRQMTRPNNTSSIRQLKRKRSSKSSGNMVLEDSRSEAMLSVWSTSSASSVGHTVIPEPIHLQTESRENPTTNYNKIIFSRKPLMRMLPYSSILASKEKHANI
ncbi:CMT1A duplicated region transcript 4 protein [Manis pentadactyla]|uniref:CMT1A duplicated region transcript 4 protein n=1 Tax=Manis pentadactyla TaxID=143292 RepID=UPI00255C6D37|nr:CMT1A duplicated region transcript 4 protein [Manis pentadactyla]